MPPPHPRPVTSRRRLARVAALGALLLLPAWGARAEPEATGGERATSWGERSLLGRVGPDVARSLVRGGDASGDLADARAEVLRGIERASASPEGVADLIKLLRDPHSAVRTDPTALLAATRALAPLAWQGAVARTLAEVVLSTSAGRRTAIAEDAPVARAPETAGRDRLELARETAALALAEAGNPEAVSLLVGVARRAGAGSVAAARALAAFPPTSLSAPVVATPEAVMLAARLGDLRAADAILDASRSLDRASRLAGLVGVGSLGDARGIGPAEAASVDPDPRVREAATSALIELGAPSAEHAVRRLIEGEDTAVRGVELALRVAGDEVLGALAARVKVSSDPLLRRAAIAALARQDSPAAVTVLGGLLADPVLSSDAAEALARSPSPAAWGAIAGAARQPSLVRLAARMAALRGRIRGGAPQDVRRAIAALARSPETLDRQTGILALTLLGERDLGPGLDDPAAGVRRSAAMAAEPTDAAQARSLTARLKTETDAWVRSLLMRGLVAADAEALTTTELRERARMGGSDAPLAVMALARLTAGDTDLRAFTAAALGSSNPLVRAHAASGLTGSREGWATGRLVEAYDAEVDPAVREAVVRALAQQAADVGGGVLVATLARAARFDPEPALRAVASRARAGLPAPEPPPSRDLLWLHVMTASGAPPPPPLVTGLVVRADGLALPVVFDEDGYALVPAGARAGATPRLVLAPRL